MHGLSKLLKLHLFTLYADVKERAAGLARGACHLTGLMDRRQNSKGVFETLVGLIGLEPMTLRLSSACSNQLSYRPKNLGTKFLKMLLRSKSMEARGLEPRTSSLQSWRSTN